VEAKLHKYIDHQPIDKVAGSDMLRFQRLPGCSRGGPEVLQKTTAAAQN